MTDEEAHVFIKSYFGDLFGSKNVEVLDTYLHKDYYDYDIGAEEQDHIGNSKAYLTSMFDRHPTIDVRVVKTMCHRDTIASFLEWYVLVDGVETIKSRGVGIFEIAEGKIRRRATQFPSPEE